MSENAEDYRTAEEYRNSEDYRHGSSDYDHDNSDVQEDREVDKANTPNPEGLPVADPSLYYRIPPNTAGLNPTTEAKYACSMLEHHSCMSTFHKTRQLQRHFALVHNMYVPPPRRGTPNVAAKPKARSKPREDHLLKQKLRNGGDFELKWWRKKTGRMKSFIVKVLTKWEVDRVQSENNPNLKLVTNPPSLARLLIRYPQIALPIPEDMRPLDKQVIDDERWALWESTLESFLVTSDGRVALNNIVERARMDLDQVEDEDEREQLHRACSLLDMAFPLTLAARVSGTPPSSGRNTQRLLISQSSDTGSGGRGSRARGHSPEPIQDAHRVNIVNAARDWMSRWRQYLKAGSCPLDKDKWVGEKALEMYKTWRRGQQPLEDYETCKMLSWRFWTPGQQKNYPDHFAEALRGFPDSQDLCSSEEEPPLELDDFVAKKVGTNNLPKFDHKQYLKRRKAKKAEREARRAAGEDVPEPQRPRLPMHPRLTDGEQADADGGAQQAQSTSFNYSAPSWMGDPGQLRSEPSYTSADSTGNPETTQQSVTSAVRRRENPVSGWKRKHMESRGAALTMDHRGTSDRPMSGIDAAVLDLFAPPRPPPRLIPGGMTAEQLSLLERLQQMRNDEIERAREREEQELQQRAMRFDEMRRDLRRDYADREEDLMKEKNGRKRSSKERRDRPKNGPTSSELADEAIVERESREPDFLQEQRAQEDVGEVVVRNLDTEDGIPPVRQVENPQKVFLPAWRMYHQSH